MRVVHIKIYHNETNQQSIEWQTKKEYWKNAEILMRLSWCDNKIYTNKYVNARIQSASPWIKKRNKKRNNQSKSGLLYFVFGIRLFLRHWFYFVGLGCSFNFRAFVLFVVCILFTHIILTQLKQSICILFVVIY